MVVLQYTNITFKTTITKCMLWKNCPKEIRQRRKTRVRRSRRRKSDTLYAPQVCDIGYLHIIEKDVSKLFVQLVFVTNRYS